MTRRHSLSQQDEYRAVLVPRFRRDLNADSLRGRRGQTLKPIRDAVSQVSPPRPPHEHTDSVSGVDELGKLYGPGEVRIFCRVVRNLSGYELLFALSIDPSHEYSRTHIRDANDTATDVLRSIEQIGGGGSSPDTRDAYLDQYELLSATDLQRVIDEYES